ncbi:hypothetical protein L8S96_06415 [Enterobacter roggenkampii]|uniref:hypothetical protein n=1 Tax=Enterobacter roggenkampii TaxID=1812935 RepID=UPI0020035B66|nr:hypothetical protein [Enterobacter roggenkampii]MCK6671535.1 hypothetical protein [Enterobacter roggenkampii]
MDHLLWHENRHRHADNQLFEPVDFSGQFQQTGAAILCLLSPPGHVCFKAAHAPLFEFAHHGSHPIP